MLVLIQFAASTLHPVFSQGPQTLALLASSLQLVYEKMFYLELMVSYQVLKQTFESISQDFVINLRKLIFVSDENYLQLILVGWLTAPGGITKRIPQCLCPVIAPPRASTRKLHKKPVLEAGIFPGTGLINSSL